MIDIHIHTGHFNEGLYFSPEEISRSMSALNVERYYFSSTSTGNVPFREVRREIESLVEMSHGRAGAYMSLCCEFGDVRITVMKECPNVFADTAFMPVNNIVRLKDEGLITRVLWGTDFPVMRYFYDIPPEDYYAQKVIEAGNALGESDFTRITRNN